MSRAFVAFYMGDYQKKTQHLDTLQHGAYSLLLQHCWIHGRIPLDASSRANIAKMTLPAWKKIAPVINAFFDEEGCNKRATEEIAKAEIIRTKRAIAGQKGGFKSGISKAIAKGEQMRSNEVANARLLPKQMGKQNPSICEPIKNSKILNTTLVAAREGIGDSPQFQETSRLMESLERLRQSKQPQAPAAPVVEELSVEGKIWVDEGSLEWSAHAHFALIRKVRMRLPIKIVVDGVEKHGAYFDLKVPPGYDEATGERIPPDSSEDAA